MIKKQEAIAYLHYVQEVKLEREGKHAIDECDEAEEIQNTINILQDFKEE